MIGIKLPSREGGHAGVSEERTTSFGVDMTSFTTRIRTMNDGSKLMLRTRGGNPEFTIQRRIGGFFRLYYAKTLPGVLAIDPPVVQASGGYRDTSLQPLLKPVSSPAIPQESRYSHCSTDGVLELWEARLPGSRATKSQHVLLVLDAEEPTADADGAHANESRAWLKQTPDNMAVVFPCEVQGKKVVAYGQPYHGAIYDDAIHREGGEVIPLPPTALTGLPFVGLPNTSLVKFDYIPIAPESTEGLDWKNSAILFGEYRHYYPFNGAFFGRNSHLHRCPDGTPYAVLTTFTIVEPANFLVRVEARKCGPDDDLAVSTLLSQYVSPARVGAYPGAFFEFSPDGKKVAIIIVRVIGTGGISDYASYHDIRRGFEVCSVYEITLAGGDGTVPLTATLSTVANYVEKIVSAPVQVYTTAYGAAAPSGSETSGLLDPLGGYTRTLGTRTVYPSLPAASDSFVPLTTVNFILGAMYDNDNELILYESSVMAANSFALDTLTRPVETDPLTYTYEYYDSPGGRVYIQAPPTLPDYVYNYTLTELNTHQILRNGEAVVENTSSITRALHSGGGTTETHYINGAVVGFSDEFWSGNFRASNNVILTSVWTNKTTPRTYKVVAPPGVLTDAENVDIIISDTDIVDSHVLPWVSWNPQTNDLGLGEGRSWI